MTPAEALSRLRATKPKRRVRANPESALTNAIVKALTARGFVAWRNNAGTIKIGNRLFRGSPAGSPDVLFILLPFGRLCGFEVKISGGKLRASQVKWMSKARQIGVRVVRVDSIGDAISLAEMWQEQEQTRTG